MVAAVLEKEEVARQQRPPPLLPTTTKETEPPQSRNFRRPCNSANLVSASAVAAAASYSEILCQNYAAVKRKSPAFFLGALENL